MEINIQIETTVPHTKDYWVDKIIGIESPELDIMPFREHCPTCKQFINKPNPMCVNAHWHTI